MRYATLIIPDGISEIANTSKAWDAFLARNPELPHVILASTKVGDFPTVYRVLISFVSSFSVYSQVVS